MKSQTTHASPRKKISGSPSMSRTKQLTEEIDKKVDEDFVAEADAIDPELIGRPTS